VSCVLVAQAQKTSLWRLMSCRKTWERIPQFFSHPLIVS
jgi:hypothetical protein